MAPTTQPDRDFAIRAEQPISFAVESARESDVPLAFGRAQVIDEIVALLCSGNDVVVEAEDGLGLPALVASVEFALAALNWRIAEASTWSSVAKETAPVLVRIDLERANATHAAILDLAQVTPGVQFLMMRHPSHPFESALPLDDARRVRRAHVVSLMPLTQADVDALIDEQLARTRMRTELGRIERLWVYANSGGYPELATALVHDCDDAPEEEGSLSRFSRATIVAASKIIGGLPESFQELAGALLPLNGVRVSRIAEVFDDVELALLTQTHVVSDADGILVIPAPIQSALRLRPTTDERRARSRDVLVDICAAHAVGAPCSEAEIMAASVALGTDLTLRTLVPLDAQRAILVTAMMLARSRGEYAKAAAMARRVMSVFPGEYPVLVKAVARSAPDPFEAFANRVTAWQGMPTPIPWWVGVSALQLPYFHVADGEIALVDRVAELAEPEEKHRFTALAEVLGAAGLLDSGQIDDAYASAENVLRRADADVTVRVRALLIQAAVSSTQLDHARLRELEATLFDLARAAHRGEDLVADVEARVTIDGLLGMALCFAAAGIRSDARVIAHVESLVVDTLRRGETSAFGLLALVYVLERSVANDSDAAGSTIRVLSKANSTVLLDWLVSINGGARSAVPPEHICGSRFIRYALRILHLAFSAFNRGIEGFSVALDEVPGMDSAFSSLARQFFESMSSERASDVAREVSVVPECLEYESLPWAFATTVQGLQALDMSQVVAGTNALLALGGAEYVERILAQTSGHNTSTETEEQLRALQIQASSWQVDEWEGIVLTRRERQVAILAAQGVSNRDIARQLFLSVRTVESHMYRAMRKLGVTREGLNLVKLLRIPEGT